MKRKRGIPDPIQAPTEKRLKGANLAKLVAAEKSSNNYRVDDRRTSSQRDAPPKPKTQAPHKPAQPLTTSVPCSLIQGDFYVSLVRRFWNGTIKSKNGKLLGQLQINKIQSSQCSQLVSGVGSRQCSSCKNLSSRLRRWGYDKIKFIPESKKNQTQQQFSQTQRNQQFQYMRKSIKSLKTQLEEKKSTIKNLNVERALFGIDQLAGIYFFLFFFSSSFFIFFSIFFHLFFLLIFSELKGVCVDFQGAHCLTRLMSRVISGGLLQPSDFLFVLIQSQLEYLLKNKSGRAYSFDPRIVAWAQSIHYAGGELTYDSIRGKANENKGRVGNLNITPGDWCLFLPGCFLILFYS